MWGAGICERCGTVVAFRTTTPVAKNLIKYRDYYCPLCGTYKLKHVQAVVNAGQLDSAYNALRINTILNNNREEAEYVASDETTDALIEQNKAGNGRRQGESIYSYIDRINRQRANEKKS